MGSATDVGAIVRLRRLVRARGVSLVHTHSSVDSWLGGIAAKSLGRAVVRSRHVSIPIRRRRALVYRLAVPDIASGEGVCAIGVGAGVSADRGVHELARAVRAR